MVSIEAQADAGYLFVNWTGDTGNVGDVNSAATTITMNDNAALQANFTLDGPPGPNLLANPSFEDNGGSISGWTDGGLNAIDNTYPASGPYDGSHYVGSSCAWGSGLRTPELRQTVALLSIALKRDLFPWFREHGIDVDQARSAIAREDVRSDAERTGAGK